MPLHQNQDGTWQWGKSGKKYKSRKKAIRQMKAIFANGYVEKHAALNGITYNDINNKGSLYMTYKDVYNMIKQAASPSNQDFDPRYSVQEGDTVWDFWKRLGGANYMPWANYQKEFLYNNPHIKDINKLRPGMRVSLGTVD